MTSKIKSGDSRVKLQVPSQIVRSGGEKRPLEYPHLYQIQAGDWRISYAVEHNRLAILVLEVLTPEGLPVKDPARENITKKMKVKLLDWAEEGGGRDMRPEELGKKLKVKLLDLVAEEPDKEPPSQEARIKPKIKLAGLAEQNAGIQRTPVEGTGAKRKVKLLGQTVEPAEGESTEEELSIEERKVTPLDSPSME
jgi:hypothetical protein